MLPKLMLVVILWSAKHMDIQYVVEYSTEAQCLAEAKRINDVANSKKWYETSYQTATCTFNLTRK